VKSGCRRVPPSLKLRRDKEVKPCGFVRHFLAKKMAVRFQNQHPQSETGFLTSKNSEFGKGNIFKNASL